MIGVGFNLVLGLSYSFYVVFNPKDHYFLQTANGVAANVASFVLADVVNTNQLGDDREWVVAQLRAGRHVSAVLARRNVILGAVMLPATMMLSAGLRLLLGEERTVASALLLDVWIVVGWLALGNVASLLVPYYPMKLRRRWHMRHTWWWWGFALVVPYGIYYARVWGLHPLLDQFFGPHAYHDARHEWREAAGYALVGVLMLFGSYGFALLIDRRPRRLIAMLEMDR